MQSFPTDESVVRREEMNKAFTKFHLNNGQVLHRFTDAADEHAHSHPWPFTSHVLSGGYEEEVYEILSDGNYTMRVERRLPGTSHTVLAGTIHRITGLLGGECFTIVEPGTWEQQPGFYEFRASGIFYRQWDGEWRPLSA